MKVKREKKDQRFLGPSDLARSIDVKLGNDNGTQEQYVRLRPHAIGEIHGVRAPILEYYDIEKEVETEVDTDEE